MWNFRTDSKKLGETGRRNARLCSMFRLSGSRSTIRDTCRRFADEELRPIAGEVDATGRYPAEQMSQLASLGLMSMADGDTLSLALAVEELARGCASTAALVSIHNCLFHEPIRERGTEAQRKQYLAEERAAEPGCFALSEPNAGSNVAEITTVARKNGPSAWTLHGTKSWVTSAPQGKAFIVFAKTDPDRCRRGMTAFIVDKGKAGITIEKKEDLIGVRALSSCTVHFDNVEVTSDDILGGVGEGFKIAMVHLDKARIGIAAQSLGIAGAAFNCALSYSLERKAFNKPIAVLPAVQSRLADMATSIESSRLLIWKAAVEYDKNTTSTKYSSMAKLSASDCANFVADNCIQISGGMGLVKGYAAERHYRDARVTKIYGGVTDVQRSIIAQQTIKEFLKAS